MIARFAAWGVVLSFCLALFLYGDRIKSPWAMSQIGSASLPVLPAAGAGCLENCK